MVNGIGNYEFCYTEITIKNPFYNENLAKELKQYIENENNENLCELRQSSSKNSLELEQFIKRFRC